VGAFYYSDRRAKLYIGFCRDNGNLAYVLVVWFTVTYSLFASNRGSGGSYCGGFVLLKVVICGIRANYLLAYRSGGLLRRTNFILK
jgi:hypothetical protein